VKIRKANVKDANELALLHLQIFNNFFMSSLGHGFLKSYYKTALKFSNTICLVSIDGNDNIQGFVLGRVRTKGYLKKLLIRGLPTFLMQGIILIFTNPKALLRLAKNLEKKDRKSYFKDKQDYSEIGLIGVKPELKGRGIGHQLLTVFEEEVKEQGAKKLSLTTDYFNNEHTLKVYKAWGFKIYYDFISYPNRRMYRLIKDIR
jgi:ribosomal protein S18 acetylase RimI-like enzyme